MTDQPGTLTRRAVLAGAAAGAATVVVPLGPAWSATARGRQDLTIVADGVPRAVVVTPDAPDQQVVNAVADLVRYVRQASGAQLPVAAASDPDRPEAPVTIYVGLPSPEGERQVTAGLRGLGEDGFVIQPVNATITILGATVRGTRYGVYEFLERYVDVRWLLPGPLGEDVPATSTIAAGSSRVRTTPQFTMRQASPFTSGTLDTSTSANINLRWGAYLRTVYTVQMGHNLNQVISVAKWGTARRDFFPILTPGGDYYVPAASQTTGWQPRFGADGIAAAAADEVLARLRANPTQTSYSLGVNDGQGFSLDDLDDTFNSMGVRSASEAYYGFVNEVADRVSAEFPDVRFGVLAYTGVADPPSFRLHDSVIPFLTRDRSCWLTAEGEALDRDVTERWLAVANEIGWYDYQTGGAFIVPLVDTEATARAYRYAADAGVRYVYAECHSRWTEGAKTWTFGKQLWDLGVDVDALRREWSTRLVGPDAAPDLIAFQEHWRDVWADKIGPGEWMALRGLRANYFEFNDATYLADVDEADVAHARTLLDRVSQRASTPRHQERADLLQRAFEYVEVSAASYPRPRPAPADAATAIAQLDDVTGTLDRDVAFAARRQEWLNENRDDPLFGSTVVLRTRGIQWSGWNFYPLWEIAAYLTAHEPAGGPVRDHAEALAAGTDSARVARYVALLLAAADGSVHTLGSNLSFDEPDIAPWRIVTSTPPPEPIGPSADVVHESPGQSLRVPLGFGGFNLSQRFAVRPEASLRATFRYFVTDGDPADAAVVPQWYFYDAAGTRIEIIRGRVQSLARSLGRWRESTLCDQVPADAVEAELFFSLSRIDRAANVVYVDATEFLQIVE